MILMRGAALKERGLTAAGRIAAASGARIACDTFAPRCQRGAGRVEVERIPYFAEQIVGSPDRYEVVQKFGEAGATVDAEDPRSDI